MKYKIRIVFDDNSEQVFTDCGRKTIDRLYESNMNADCVTRIEIEKLSNDDTGKL